MCDLNQSLESLNAVKQMEDIVVMLLNYAELKWNEWAVYKYYENDLDFRRRLSGADFEGNAQSKRDNALPKDSFIMKIDSLGIEVLQKLRIRHSTL